MPYDRKFLGIDLPLPEVKPERTGNILHREELVDEVLAEYPNYAVLTDAEKRAPAYVVAMIDRLKMKKTTRTDKWRIDTRIGEEFQLDNAYYTRNVYDRGHLARRESAGWGDTQREAQEASDRTFYYSNACLQHENVNQDEWLALEDWVQDLDIAKEGKIVVFAGPIYGDTPRIVKPSGREPAEVPAAFFKVVAFVNNGETDSTQKDKLDVRAFLMFQDEAAIRDKDGRQTFDYQHYQVTIREIEQLTGLDFPDEVYERNPLCFHENEKAKELGATSFPERIDVNSKEDLVGHGEKRTPVRDDQIQVYIAAAQIAPSAGDEEWVSILNLEPNTVDLSGWQLRDHLSRVAPLTGTVQPGEAKAFRASSGLGPIKLPDNGGLLILLNDRGEQIDRIDYIKKDISRWKKNYGAGVPVYFATYRSPIVKGTR